MVPSSIGALVVGIGLWGPLHYNSDKAPPKIYLVLAIVSAPI